MALLLGLDDGLVGLEVFTDPLVNRLLSNLVIICRLDLYHVFEVVDVAGAELLTL